MSGYVPMLHGLELGGWWAWTVVPLVVLIAVSYKGMRVGRVAEVWRASVVMSVQVLGILVGLALVLSVVFGWVIPALGGVWEVVAG